MQGIQATKSGDFKLKASVRVRLFGEESHQEDELCYNEISPHQQDCQDQDPCKQGRGTTSKLQSGTEVVEMMQAIQSDSSFSDQFCLGKRPFYSFKSQAEQNKYFSTIFTLREVF